MHGILFETLKDFVVAERDHETWDEVRARAGLDRRVADHYGESVTVTVPTCVYDGGDHCRIVVRR